MLAVDQDREDRSSGHIPRDLAGAILVPLHFIGSGLGLYKIFRWLQDERARIVTIRELHRLNDDYLDDIGIKRKDIRPIVNAMVRHIRNRRRDSSCP